MFGCEQSWIQSRAALRWVYQLIGEIRFPLRLRGLLLSRALPPDFRPVCIWDAGSGRGHTSFYLARRYPEAQVTGTDIDAGCVTHCQQIVSRSHITHVDFRCQDFVNSEVPEMGSFDLVVCSEVLEHIEDFQRALRAIGASLRRQGLLIIHTPAAGRFQGATFGLRRFFRPAEPGIQQVRGQLHVRPGFELKQLISAVEEVGMTVDDARYTFGPLAMFAHTIYEATRSSSLWLATTFPLLMTLGWVDSWMDHKSGGGILIRARKN